MKKTLSLTVSILLITCYAIAQQQTKKGRWLVMHSFGGFEYETEKKPKHIMAPVINGCNKRSKMLDIQEYVCRSQLWTIDG